MSTEKEKSEAIVKTLDEFTRHYIVAALWSSMDSYDNNGQPLDANYSAEDIDADTLIRMRDDCASFQAENAVDLMTWPGGQYTAEEVGGHDFWLTRNRHGSGFWDGDWPKAAGERLTTAANKFKECDLYVGDDGRLYI